MLLSFKVKNYRSIKDPVLFDLQATNDDSHVNDAVFECGKFSLLKSAAIYGPNASGKSNIFKAFLVFRLMILESLFRSTLTENLPSEPFKLDVKRVGEPTSFEMKFLLDGEVFSYGFQFNTQRIWSEWLKRERGNVEYFSRTGQEIKSNKNSYKEATSALKNQTAPRVLFLSVLASNNAPVAKKITELIKRINFISGAERGDTLNYSFGEFVKDSKRAEKMKQFIVQADFGVRDIQANERIVSAKQLQNIPDKFKEFLFEENSQIAEREIKFLHVAYDKNGKETSGVALDFLQEESEGTQQMFALSAPIIDTLENGKILCIDEIDSSLHPMLCRYLVTLFNSKERNRNNAQIIFTTHDISLLSEEFLRRDQIFFTKKKKDGSTELFSLADLSERKGADFSKRYMEGRYDALPYIEDYENLKIDQEV
jgi:uncharacterized protein